MTIERDDLITITQFTPEHIAAAHTIVRENLDAERQLIPALPDTDAPELSGMTGAAAIENGELIGFFCAPPPHDPAFGTAAKGIFSPLHANGVTRKTGIDRARVMTRLYT